MSIVWLQPCQDQSPDYGSVRKQTNRSIKPTIRDNSPRTQPGKLQKVWLQQKQANVFFLALRHLSCYGKEGPNKKILQLY